MPRRKRPSPPAPGSLPLRPIAPRPESGDVSPETSFQASSTLSRSISRSNSEISSTESDHQLGSCGVPQCKLKNCNLSTHLNYGRQRRLALLNGGTIPKTELDLLAKNQAFLADVAQLPIDDTSAWDFQRLLDEFWEDHHHKLTLVYQPQRLDPAFTKGLQLLASKNGIYCLTLVALAHLAAIKGGYGNLDAEVERLTDLIYSRLVQATREKIDAFEVAEIDVLLLAITTLCTYDMMLDRHEALDTHYRGVIALVSSKGGVHNLDLSLPFVINMDRLLAVRANEMPRYTSFSKVDMATNLSVLTASASRGTSFSTLSTSSLSSPVMSLCVDAAQLLMFMDEINVNFDPSRQSDVNSSKLEYFRYLRDEIDSRHAVLNYEMSLNGGITTKDVPVLTAMRIVTYYLAMDNFLPFETDMWAARLWNSLTKAPFIAEGGRVPVQGYAAADSSASPSIKLNEWTENMPMLLWLLFACALPGARAQNLSFTARLELETTASAKASQVGESTRMPRGKKVGAAIVSPSSPKRYRHLPSFILRVAEHLVGERPLSGTEEWDEEVCAALESYIWDNVRLGAEFKRIIERVHENVLMRAEADL